MPERNAGRPAGSDTERGELEGVGASERTVSSIAASGGTASVGGTATISISAESVDGATVSNLWTDWTVDSVGNDGATFTDEIATAGRCRFDWDSTQTSVAPSLTVALPIRYVGGTYELVVTGGDPGGSAQTTTAVTVEQVSPGFTVETVVSGLDQPWGMTFLPDDTQLLVTERVGRLNLLDHASGTAEVVSGTPDVLVDGQGGLLDVALHPAFPNEPWVYLTYSAENSASDSATHLGRGKLDRTTPELTSFEQLQVAEPFVDSGGHYGSRVTFDGEDLLYMTSGDRQFRNFGPGHVSQDTSNELGSTLRLQPDGSIPSDNPFVDDEGAADAIFSYGHRNPQGITVHPETGAVWQSEHGERDGDEINVVERGGNFGWPVASEACKYGTDEPVGDSHDERDDVVNPVYYWPCGSGGYPPAGATFYSGDAFPEWAGDLFVGNLAKQFLGRFAVSGREVVQLDPLLTDRNWRIRDVEEEPDSGHLYVAVDGGSAPVVRLRPDG